MKYLIIGLGNQGQKRLKYLDNSAITVDPINTKADFSDIKHISNNILRKIKYAIISCPDKNKFNLINKCLDYNINVLVEKPLWFSNTNQFNYIQKKANKSKLLVYTAYNHRFEPIIEKCKDYLELNKLGKIYYCNFFYGNGTAQLVKNSNWKDFNHGLISDLGSHLLDLYYFLFNKKLNKLKIVAKNTYENKFPDHIIFKNEDTNNFVNFEITYCMWKNDFNLNVIAEKGSVHLNNLCKWGTSTLEIRTRLYPSGVPKIKIKKFKMPDPTWIKEINFFKKLVKNKTKTDLTKDLWIFKSLKSI